MVKKETLYSLYWQLKRSMKSIHFNPLFFLLSQLLWPLLLLGSFYLSYTPLFQDGNGGILGFTDQGNLWSFLIPGIMVIYLYMEYINIGAHLSFDRDYGVLEPIFISPVNRSLWLFGSVFSAIPSSIISQTALLVSAQLLFPLPRPNIPALVLFMAVVFITSLPWGAMVAAIFLSGRNMRVLWTVFETPAEFLSGSRFPLTALPTLLSSLALLYPLSHGVSLLRLAWYETIPWNSVMKETLWLFSLGIFYSFLALGLFRWAEERGKRQGSLSFT